MTGTFPDDSQTLWERLGVLSSATSEEITQAYQSSQKTPEQRYAWKALTSRQYRKVYERFGTSKALYDAGFFADQYEGHVSEHPVWDVNFMSTPFDMVFTGLKKLSIYHKAKSPTCVQLITGAFSPLHEGHIRMARIGAERLKQAGWEVLGTYFAPGNDSYVDTKANGTASKHASVRVETAWASLRGFIAAQEPGSVKLADFCIDPWAAEYMPYEINFTDHIDRLKAYLKAQVPEQEVEVAYVFGSDNAGFSYAFYDEGLAVCVEREGKSSPALADIRADANPNVLLCDTVVPDISSTKVRNGQWTIDTNAMNIYRETVVIDHPRYLIRDEGLLALQHWVKLSGEGPVDRAKKTLRDVLVKQVKLALADDMQVEILDTEFQRQAATRFIGSQKTLSLDPFFQGTYQIGLSRTFVLAGHQASGSSRHVERPGKSAYYSFGQEFAPGNYLIIEDDVSTGDTIKAVKETLSRFHKEVNVIGEVLLTDYYRHPVQGNQFFDVVDLRDFMVGSLHGGLVSELGVKGINDNTTRIRMPYMAPYVNLSTRALIPARHRKAFSIALWQANVDFFEEIPGKIGHTPTYFQDLAMQAGWKLRDKMVDFCAWHVKLLSDQS